MIIISSPSKSMANDYKKANNYSTPFFEKEITQVANKCKKLRKNDIGDLMGISQNLVEKTYDRFKHFLPELDGDQHASAIYKYTGDVYVGLDANSLSEEDIDYAQDHFRIITGLYGILRPKDLIQEYRLEMGTKLKVGRKDNLYEFWSKKLTKFLHDELVQHDHPWILNVASNEYSKAIDFKALKFPVVNAEFREWRKEKWTFISFNAKKARGLITRYAIQNKIQDIETLKGFDLDNYYYNEELSSPDKLFFTK